jgi:hypothetical protein
MNRQLLTITSQGKTLQTIVTLLDNRPKLQHCQPGTKHPPSEVQARLTEDALWNTALKEWNHELDMLNITKNARPRGTRAGTLIVCPVIALSQWKAEIEKFTAPDTLSVAIYHGPKRQAEKDLHNYDIVLTTYQVLEQDFRKMVSPNKVACPNCGGKFKVDKLRVHLKYFCGDGAQRTEAQMRQQRGRGRGGPPRGGGPQGGGRGGGKKSPEKKPPMTKAEAKTTPRKAVRVRATAEYDSDSGLSVQEKEENTKTIPSARPSRSAAVKASKQVRTGVKDWGGASEEESSFSSESSSDDDDDSGPPLAKLARPPDSESSSDDDSDTPLAKMARSRASSDVKRAMSKQKQALEAVKTKSSKKPPQKSSKKSPSKKTSPKKAPKGKGKHKKSPSSGSEDSSGEDDDEPNDPMEGIDMDALVQEAMDGSRFSLLHGFCWWRVVLDEGHIIKSRSSQTAA